MRGAEEATPAAGWRWRGYTWGLLALLSCPCHLPVLALLLSGTAAGAMLGAHAGVAALVLAVVFVLFLAAARGGRDVSCCAAFGSGDVNMKSGSELRVHHR